MKILVLLGGDSPEREVSLRSGKAVAKALSSLHHEVFEYDPIGGYDGLSDFKGNVDCVFPIIHGKTGEDGEIQGQLEKYGFKYLGTNPSASKLCFDKVAFKKELNKLNITTPAYEIVDKNSFAKSLLTKKPYVLKPIEGGSTIGAFIIRNLEEDSVDLEIFDKYPEMLLEELIEGDEITVPVLGKNALPVIEIIPPVGGEFDYENKYNGATQEICPPKNVPAEHQKQAQEIAELIHNKVRARHLSRTDIMIDKQGKLWVLELNTMPGLTDQSLFPKAAKVAGMTFDDLVAKFVEMASR